ncbi:hypothetical protein HGRIS_006299 [Hohenbuehelia grisea]|uniref:Protein-S-isoprenylcysteine O-methyltransferase n=1 Tax=Hohenbuehelia grisea TaxID=104357 RepID=A0ABR3K1S0_9AGAR
MKLPAFDQHVTALAALGSLTTFLGALLRLKCYSTLGPLFTFELGILHDHKLVQSGPYAFVRHPSYTGMIMTILGVICSHSTQGSWLRESGILEWTLMRFFVCYWLVTATAVIASLILRLTNEDAILEREFGSEWSEWAQEVPYRLVPGIY